MYTNLTATFRLYETYSSGMCQDMILWFHPSRQNYAPMIFSGVSEYPRRSGDDLYHL